MKKIQIHLKKLAFCSFLFLFFSCEESNTEELQNISLSSKIIGTWQVYDIQLLDSSKNKINLPEYLSIDCDSRTKYIFSKDGNFEMLNRTSYRAIYNQQNELENYDCVSDDEGGGFESGSWKIVANEGDVEILDIDWLYKEGTTRTDGMLWNPEFLTNKTFLISDYDEYDELYFNYYYERID